MTTQSKTSETFKKFASVSLPVGLADSLKEEAAIQGRTIATQIEHWAIIGRAVESVIPAPALVALKSGQDAGEIMSRISAYLLHQQPSLLIAKLEAGKSPRYGVDPKDSSVAIRIEPDGTETRGRWDVAGNFIATHSPPSKKPQHATKSPTHQDKSDKHRASSKSTRVSESHQAVSA